MNEKTTRLRKARFRNAEYITDFDGQSGFLATEDQYRNFETSFAHIYGDQIRQYGDVIGQTAEIEFGDTVEVDATDLGLERAVGVLAGNPPW